MTGGLLIKIALLLITSVRQLAELGVLAVLPPFMRGEVIPTLEPTVFHGGDSGRGTISCSWLWLLLLSSTVAMEASGAGESVVDWGVRGDRE